MDADKEELEKARFFFELALKSDKVIEEAYKRVNEKIRNFLTVATALIPVVAALGYFILKDTTAYWVLIPVLISLAFMLLAVARGITLEEPTGFLYVKPLQFKNRHKTESLRYIINKAASTWSDVVEQNCKVVNSKESGLNQMLRLIGIGLLILTIAFLCLGIAR